MKVVDPDGRLTLEQALQKTLLLINQSEKQRVGVEETQTRSAVELIQQVQQLAPLANISYTDSALVIAAIQILSMFALKLVDKTKDDDVLPSKRE